MIVQERKVSCDSGAIHTALVFFSHIHNRCQSLVKNEKLDEMKKWIAPLISHQKAPEWLIKSAQIKEKDLNVAARY